MGSEELSSAEMGFPPRSKRTVDVEGVEEVLPEGLVGRIHSNDGSNVWAVGKNLRRISSGVPSSAAPLLSLPLVD